MAFDLSSAVPGSVVAQFSPPASTPEDLARYAQASGDLNPLHLNIDFARQAGFDNLVVHGMLSMAHLGRLLTDNFPAEQLRNFNVRFEGVVTAGQRVSYSARVESREGDTLHLLLEGLVDDTGKRAVSGKASVLLA